MSAPAALALVLAACAEGGAGPADELGADVSAADSSVSLTFEVGTHPLNLHRPQSTTILRDRSPLEIVVGAQGLKMAVLVPRVFGELTLPLTAQAELESGQAVLGRVDRELEPPHLDQDGAAVFHDLVILIAPELRVPDDWARLRVVLTDAAGRRGEERWTVRLVLP